MVKKARNNVRLSGLLYDAKLEKKVTGPNSKSPGTEYITGKISIAVDDALTNIVDVRYPYVVPTTVKDGVSNPNPVYGILDKIMEGVLKSVMSDGIEEAAKLRADTSLALNEFYSDRSGQKQLVSTMLNEGGYLRLVNNLSDELDDRNLIDVDMAITSVRTVEKDDNEKIILGGYIFNFRNAALPVEFSVTNERAKDYFSTIDASKNNPMYINLRGRVVNETITKVITEEGAFEDCVKEVKSHVRDYRIHWASKNSYYLGDEEFFTKSEFKDVKANREIYLKDLETRFDNSKKVVATPKTVVSKPSDDEYDF